MTTKEAKEFLSQAKALDVKLRTLKRELRAIHEKAESTARGYSLDRVQTSVTGDRMAKLIAACIDLESEIMETNISLLRQRLVIVTALHKLSDYRHIEVLYWKYICYKRLEDICDLMRKSNGEPYSFDHVAALHGEAIKAFAEVMPSDIHACA